VAVSRVALLPAVAAVEELRYQRGTLLSTFG
jgi:hypothetical protein